MAKTSSIERNKKRERLGKKFAARRAKLRLTSEEGSDQIVLTSAATPLSVEDLPPSQRPAGKVAKSGAKDKSGPILTPRVAALAIALVVAGGVALPAFTASGINGLVRNDCTLDNGLMFPLCAIRPISSMKNWIHENDESRQKARSTLSESISRFQLSLSLDLHGIATSIPSCAAGKSPRAITAPS